MKSMYPSASVVHSVFSAEMAALGGTVRDTHLGRDLLYVRGVLPTGGDVRPGDRFLGGVALRVDGPCIEVIPYTYRLVCKNGAIHASATDQQIVERSEYEAPWILAELRGAIAEAARPEMFEMASDDVSRLEQLSAESELIDIMQHGALFLSRAFPTELVRAILDTYRSARDVGPYAFLNAITATARDTTPPQLRWHLEAAGGAFAASVGALLSLRRGAATLSATG